jgi:hypothetical protein
MNRLPSDDIFRIDRLPQPFNTIFADANLIALKPLFGSPPGTFLRVVHPARCLRHRASTTIIGVLLPIVPWAVLHYSYPPTFCRYLQGSRISGLLMDCSQSLDHDAGVFSSRLRSGRAECRCSMDELDRRFVADRAMRSHFD